ncbi:hypothetical protein K438DRAFT_9228 [Mycena galopus ATCC 62051]|nr:hypothetical protein K438DRAFT_9228 [Mycena galopus ATCC 62051]
MWFKVFVLECALFPNVPTSPLEILLSFIKNNLHRAMGKAHGYDPHEEYARSSRFWTGSKPFAYWILAIVFTTPHHWMNAELNGKAM